MKYHNSMDNSDIAEFLHKTIYFEQVSVDELKTISGAFSVVEYDAGEIVFEEGDVGESFFVIKSGEVEISVKNGDGIVKVLSVKKEYEGFGELSIIDSQVRSATVKCIKPTVLFKLDKADFEMILKNLKSFSSSLAYVLTNIVRNNTDMIIKDLRDKNEMLRKSLMQLQELQGTLVKNERLIAVGKFASRMMHDLKNMLSQVHNAIQLITHKNNKNKIDEYNPYFDVIKNSVLEMNELCQEVMEYSKGDIKLNMFPVSIADILNHYIQITEETISIHNIKLETDINSKAIIKGDMSKLERVFNNIVFNSIDALDKIEYPKIIIRCYDYNDFVVIEFEDNGKGIPLQEQKKVFDSFYSFGKSHGTGLGLSISKEIIVYRHKGGISLESTEGKGTKIIIKLPVYKKSSS